MGKFSYKCSNYNRFYYCWWGKGDLAVTKYMLRLVRIVVQKHYKIKMYAIVLGIPSQSIRMCIFSYNVTCCIKRLISKTDDSSVVMFEQ